MITATSTTAMTTTTTAAATRKTNFLHDQNLKTSGGRQIYGFLKNVENDLKLKFLSDASKLSPSPTIGF